MRPLSTSEIKVLGFLVQGDTNKQIAEALFITPETVKNHVTHILTKLDAKNLNHAVAIALMSELLQVAINPGVPNHTALAEAYLRSGSLSCFCGGNRLVVKPGYLKCDDCGQLIKLVHSVEDISLGDN